MPWLIRQLAGEISSPDAVRGGVGDTWRYTKRQATWFRNRMPGWSWIEPVAAQALILREISQISA